VETFHIVSECKTDVYFERWLIQRLPNDTAVPTISTKSLLVTADRRGLTILTETEQDHKLDIHL
jgi:hypothetical protein